MNPNIQKACVWSGPVFMVICGLGLFAFAGFVPPPNPADSSQEIADMFRDDTNMIRLGLLLVVIGTAFLGPFVAIIAMQMKRIEGQFSPLTYAQLMLGACLMVEFFIPVMAVQTSAYRPYRDGEILKVFNDFGWLTFYGVASTIVLQVAIIGIAVLCDRRPDPIFPRWFGYFNIWIAFLISPGTILVFFKDGPFAWNGLFVFWMPFTAFFIWIVLMTRLLLSAINRHVAEQLLQPAPVAATDSELGRQVTALSSRLALVTDELTVLRDDLARSRVGQTPD